MKVVGAGGGGEGAAGQGGGDVKVLRGSGCSYGHCVSALCLSVR